MPIRLSPAQIKKALPKVKQGLDQYLRIQSRVAASNDFHQDAGFRRQYNGFYRVRRAPWWQEKFYGLMGRAKGERLGFPAILDKLHEATNRYEASFVSKLVATLDASRPVIDSVVLNNVGLRLPASGAKDRAARICRVYSELISLFSDYLSTGEGEYLVSEFRRANPGANVTDVKMLDLVLWQTRS